MKISNDRLTIRNVTMNDTCSIQCCASNGYGRVLSSVYLNVHGKCSLGLRLLRLFEFHSFSHVACRISDSVSVDTSWRNFFLSFFLFLFFILGDYADCFC